MEILHNSRCGKSRHCLAFLEENGKEFTVKNYLENKLSVDQIASLLTKLKIQPIALVRQNESVWKDNFKNKKMSDKDIIEAMAEFPILIQRPIVINGESAYIARDEAALQKLI